MILNIALFVVANILTGLFFYCLGYNLASNYWQAHAKANLSREYCDGFAQGKTAAFNAMKRKLGAKENQA